MISEEKLNQKYDWISPSNYTDEYGNREFQLKGKYGLISINGNEVVKPIYDLIWSLEHEYIVRLNGKYGLIDKNGKILLPCKYNVKDDLREIYKRKLKRYNEILKENN